MYEVLGCPRTATAGQLRKAYYRSALKFHPDKNPGHTAEFQAISRAYEVLGNEEHRKAYDETGILPEDDDNEKTGDWKAYFEQIFGKVTSSDIESFASKYKCSDEEERDVIKEFKAQKGNLVKMLDFVMLSEPRDAPRWVQDFIRPAMKAGTLSTDFEETMERSLEKCKTKMKNEKEGEEEDDDEEIDEDETETEEDEPPPKKKAKKTPPKKKAVRAKHSKKSDMASLVSAIQNKRSGSVLTDLSARYGIPEDPLSDEQFRQAQAKLNKKK